MPPHDDRKMNRPAPAAPVVHGRTQAPNRVPLILAVAVVLWAYVVATFNPPRSDDVSFVANITSWRNTPPWDSPDPRSHALAYVRGRAQLTTHDFIDPALDFLAAQHPHGHKNITTELTAAKSHYAAITHATQLLDDALAAQAGSDILALERAEGHLIAAHSEARRFDGVVLLPWVNGTLALAHQACTLIPFASMTSNSNSNFNCTLLAPFPPPTPYPIAASAILANLLQSRIAARAPPAVNVNTTRDSLRTHYTTLRTSLYHAKHHATASWRTRTTTLIWCLAKFGHPCSQWDMAKVDKSDTAMFEGMQAFFEGHKDAMWRVDADRNVLDALFASWDAVGRGLEMLKVDGAEVRLDGVARVLGEVLRVRGWAEMEGPVENDGGSGSGTEGPEKVKGEKEEGKKEKGEEV